MKKKQIFFLGWSEFLLKNMRLIVPLHIICQIVDNYGNLDVGHPSLFSINKFVRKRDSVRFSASAKKIITINLS